MRFDKLPPQAVDVEEAILGAIMLERDSFNVVNSILKEDDFYKDSHRLIYKAISELFTKSEPIDIKTVTHQLKKNNDLELSGGAYYVVELTTKVNSADNIYSHALIVKEYSMKRQMIKLATELLSDAYDESIGVHDLIESTDKKLTLINQGSDIDNIVNLGNADKITEVIEEISLAKSAKENNTISGISTGLNALDEVSGGLQNTDLIIVAARPGMGKTALMGGILLNATKNNDSVLMFSLEMSWQQISKRLLSPIAEISVENMRSGNIMDYQMDKLLLKSAELVNRKILIDDTPGISISKIRSRGLIQKKKHNIKLIIVDYIQLARGDVQGNREQEIASISRGLKNIAKELNVPVIALSQLSRKVEERGGDKRPQLSDLRESGSIEQDADQVWFLYRPEYYGITQDSSGNSTSGMASVIIAKHRHGRTGEAWQRFIGMFTKWDDIVKDVF
jgi:replicative DNA helicase